MPIDLKRLFVTTLSALAGACAAASPPAERPEVAEAPTASTVAWAAPPPPPAASSAPVASASASASAPVAAGPVPASCSGSALTLDAVVADPACAFSGDPPPLPDSIVARTEPTTATVGSGKWLALRIVVENRSDVPVTIAIEAAFGGFGELDGDGLIGLGSIGSIGRPGKPKGKPRPPSPPPEKRPPVSPGVSTSTEDLAGHDLDQPSGGAMFGMIGIMQKPPLVRIELAPHGTLTANARWRARGYLPGKDYAQKSSSQSGMVMIAPPEPLPKGTYIVRPTFPIPKLVGSTVAVTVTKP